MAWALQFDGVNDYVSSAVIVPKPTGDNYLEVDVIFDNLIVGSTTRIAWVGPSGAQGIGIEVRYDSRIVFSGRGNTIGSASFLAVAGERRALKIAYESGDYVGYFDGVEVGRFSNGIANSDSDGFFLGKNPSSSVGNDAFSIVSAEWNDTNTPSNNRLYDATASSHAAGTPVLIDTIGGNNATGVNMPTDGSAWIDLGGGGDENSNTITSILPSLVSSSVLSKVDPVIFNNNITSTMPKLISSVQVEILEPIFSTGINSELPSLTSSAQLSYSIGANTAAISSSLPSLQSSVKMAYFVGGNAVNVNSTLPSLTSSVTFTQSIPEFDFVINSSMPSLISSVEIQAVSKGTSAAISSTMPSIISSATFNKLEPEVLNLLISSTLPSLHSNANFYNGVLNVVVGRGNNIDIMIKSTNINIQTKSRII